MAATYTGNGSNVLKRLVVGLAELPTELIYMLTDLLDPNDVFHCRLISCEWFRIFTAPALLKRILVDHYPKTREVRRLLTIDPPEVEVIWKTTFDKILARYSALKIARPRSVTTLKLYDSASAGNQNCLQRPYAPGQHPIARWDRYHPLIRTEAFEESDEEPTEPVPKKPNCEPSERFWACDDSGLLIFLDIKRQLYVLHDLNAPERLLATVPFLCHGRIVRRIRLGDSLLIIEWAEEEPYHQLNLTEAVHRHFVTTFDVTVAPFFCLDALQPTCKVEFRNEWKLHFLGFPLNSQDLWLSTHTSTHYAAYIWQPNRSAWGEDEPIESLSVWDISQRSEYRPSMDPSGGSMPLDGPQTVNKLSYKTLDHLGIRQRDAPVLRTLEMDADMASSLLVPTDHRIPTTAFSSYHQTIYFHESRAHDEAGEHAGRHLLDNELSSHWERKVGIPITGSGPPWVYTFSSALQSLPCQIFDDDIAGIRYHVAPHQKPRIFMKHKDWRSCLDISGYGRSPSVSIYADERWVVMQCGDGLRILRFDHRPGDKGFGLDGSCVAAKPRRSSPLAQTCEMC